MQRFLHLKKHSKGAKTDLPKARLKPGRFAPLGPRASPCLIGPGSGSESPLLNPSVDEISSGPDEAAVTSPKTPRVRNNLFSPKAPGAAGSRVAPPPPREASLLLRSPQSSEDHGYKHTGKDW